jgi:pimeloyl-ACP methyl ester carboxylesterase
MMTPAKAAQALAARIAGCRVAFLPESGHAMMQEAPGAVLDALKGFLKP